MCSMMTLESFHEFEDHLPCFFWYNDEVGFLTLGGVGILPLMFGFAFFAEEIMSFFLLVSFGFLRLAVSCIV